MRLQETDFDKDLIPEYNPDIRDVIQPPEEARDVSEWWKGEDVEDVSKTIQTMNAYGWLIGLQLQEDTPRDEWKKRIKKIQEIDPLPLRETPDGEKYYDRDECDEWGRKHGLKTASKKQGGKPEECPPFHKPDGNGGYQYVPREKFDKENKGIYWEDKKKASEEEEIEPIDEETADFLIETNWVDRKIDEYEQDPPTDEEVTEWANGKN